MELQEVTSYCSIKYGILIRSSSLCYCWSNLNSTNFMWSTSSVTLTSRVMEWQDRCQVSCCESGFSSWPSILKSIFISCGKSCSKRCKYHVMSTIDQVADIMTIGLLSQRFFSYTFQAQCASITCCLRGRFKDNNKNNILHMIINNPLILRNHPRISLMLKLNYISCFLTLSSKSISSQVISSFVTSKYI